LTIERTELLVSGTVSPMARQQIEALGVAVKERSFEQLKDDSTQSADAPVGSDTE
jgi:uncharacterized protein YgbK (DUF1537 family)